MPTLHLFLRKSYHDQYSIEKLFRGIVPHLEEKGNYEIKVLSMPYDSKGLINRLKNLWFTYKHSGDINHVTGDIHFIVFALLRSKTILTIHDCGTVLRLRGLKLLFFKLLWLQWPSWWVKNITVISDKTRDDLVNIIKIDPKKITVIPNYIQSGFLPSPMPESLPYKILHIGTAPHKNWTRLAQALYGIPCELTIIGRLTKADHRFLQQENVNYIHLFDLSEEQLKDAYRQTNVVFFASTFEGFGMPILEAQASGRPVITSNISPMDEVAGLNALLVNPLNTSDIHNTILNIMLNPVLQNNTIISGLENIKRYTPDQIAAQYNEVYKSIAR